jgi:hypothetical protein
MDISLLITEAYPDDGYVSDGEAVVISDSSSTWSAGAIFHWPVLDFRATIPIDSGRAQTVPARIYSEWFNAYEGWGHLELQPRLSSGASCTMILEESRPLGFRPRAL